MRKLICILMILFALVGCSKTYNLEKDGVTKLLKTTDYNYSVDQTEYLVCIDIKYDGTKDELKKEYPIIYRDIFNKLTKTTVTSNSPASIVVYLSSSDCGLLISGYVEVKTLFDVDWSKITKVSDLESHMEITKHEIE